MSGIIVRGRRPRHDGQQQGVQLADVAAQILSLFVDVAAQVLSLLVDALGELPSLLLDALGELPSLLGDIVNCCGSGF